MSDTENKASTSKPDNISLKCDKAEDWQKWVDYRNANKEGKSLYDLMLTFNKETGIGKIIKSEQ